jgi:hypothetical protein
LKLAGAEQRFTRGCCLNNIKKEGRRRNTVYALKKFSKLYGRLNMPELSIPLPPEDKLVLLPKNPGSLFVFWSFSSSRGDQFRAASLGAEVELRLFRADDKTQVSSSKAGWEKGGAYLAAPAHGGTYAAALYVLRGGEWERVLESNQAASPAAAGSAQDRAYASLEFHKRSST